MYLFKIESDAWWECLKLKSGFLTQVWIKYGLGVASNIAMCSLFQKNYNKKKLWPSVISGRFKFWGERIVWDSFITKYSSRHGLSSLKVDV